MVKIVKRVHKAKGRKRRKGAGRNNGPARQRYWASGRLEARKVKALMEHMGMTRHEATLHWREVRKGRIKTRSV